MMKNTILYLLFTGFLLSSCTGYHIRKGNTYYEHYAYSKAIQHYEKANSKDDDLNYKSKLAHAYLNVNDIVNAHKMYEDILKKSTVKPFDYFNYAKSLMGIGEYEKASIYFEKYLGTYPNDIVANMLFAASLSVNERYRDTTLFTLKPILTETKASSFGVIEYQNGIVFNADKEVFLPGKKSQWTGRSYLDLYYMEKDNEGNWLDPELLKGDISGPFHDGPATFSKDGKTVYFTRSNYYRRKLKTSEQNVSNLKIFKAELIGEKWKNLSEFEYNSDDYSVGHPSLSQDGKTLYFVSDMEGGFGGTDLYRCFLDEDGKWSEPENLGEVINTPANEMFPFIHEDGALYFSSNAHNSMGGLDVFITYHNGEKWALPENLNYPINSSGDDFAFSINSDNLSGFVSSTRRNKDEIYEFKKNRPTFRLFGFARKKGTDIPVEGVTVEITEEETSEVIRIESGKDGKFQLNLKPDSKYLLLCTKEGCFTRTDEIITKGLKYSEDFYADFLVEEIVIGKPIVLENIYYDFDKCTIRKDAAEELNKLVQLLKDNPDIDIEMGSHTDSRGPSQYNDLLSSRRAISAVRYLIRQGINPDRLTWKGYGKTELVNECDGTINCTEKQHQENRRTEFKVTQIRE